MLSLETKQHLPAIQAFMATQPVAKAWLFGSCSRGEETATSDMDIMVSYDDSAAISLLTISRMMCALRKIVGRKVDLVEEDRLLPFAQASAQRDRMLIYERATRWNN